MRLVISPNLQYRCCTSTMKPANSGSRRDHVRDEPAIG
jgi:hypothetical protein